MFNEDESLARALYPTHVDIGVNGQLCLSFLSMHTSREAHIEYCHDGALHAVLLSGRTSADTLEVVEGKSISELVEVVLEYVGAVK